MTHISPVVFKAHGMGREIAMLGAIQVGAVQPYLCGRRIRAVVVVSLPDVLTGPMKATSIDEAKDIVRQRVEDWLDAAGLVSGSLR